MKMLNGAKRGLEFRKQPIKYNTRLFCTKIIIPTNIPTIFCARTRDKAHRRPARRLGDRFCVGRIVLLSLDEGFDVDGWDQ